MDHPRRDGATKRINAMRTSQPRNPQKFRGGKEEQDSNYFDCTSYGQSDIFMKTVQKIADHICQEYRVGSIMRTKVMTKTAGIILLPTRPVGISVTGADGVVTRTPPDVLDISDYQSAKKIFDYQVQHQSENRQKIFSLVWQQCTESMHARNCPEIERALNGIDLLKMLICFNIEDEQYAAQKVHETKAAFYALKQGRDSDQAYQTKFISTVQVIEQCGASLGEDPRTDSHNGVQRLGISRRHFNRD
jgi:hypothetical protein